MDKLIWQFFNKLYNTVCNPNVNEAEIHYRWSKNSVVYRSEPLLILKDINFEPKNKILAQSVSKKPKENVLRKWYESSKIKITKISCGIWVKSGKARCILNAFTRNHLNHRKMIKVSRNIWQISYDDQNFGTKFSTHFRNKFHTVANIYQLDIRLRFQMFVTDVTCVNGGQKPPLLHKHWWFHRLGK